MIGYYIPVKRDEAARKKALAAFETKLETFLEETGLDEDELAESLTVSVKLAVDANILVAELTRKRGRALITGAGSSYLLPRDPGRRPNTS